MRTTALSTLDTFLTPQLPEPPGARILGCIPQAVEFSRRQAAPAFGLRPPHTPPTGEAPGGTGSAAGNGRRIRGPTRPILSLEPRYRE